MDVGVSLLHFYAGLYSLESVKVRANFLALCYAVWNGSTGYLHGSAIRDLFRRERLLNMKLGVGRYSYPVFLVHGIIVTGA